MKDGKVVAACAEERFVREKGYGGFPAQSVGYCLKEAGLKAEDIDLVAAGDLGATALGFKFVYVQRRARFSVEDYVREAREYWYPKLYEGKDIDYLEVFKDKLCLDTFPEEFNRYFFGNADKYKKADMFEMQKLKKYLIHSYYPQISEDRIKFYPHHEMHAFYGYYGSRFAEEKDPVLIVTADSWGDLSNGTISRFEDGEFEVLHTVDNHNLGRLFRNITLYLGMKPYDHEYKVMGLAPYAPMYLSDAAYKVFSNVLSVDGLDFIYKEKPQDHYFWYKKRLEGIRFDGVAAGLQRHFEECVQKWIRNAIVKYGVKKVCFSGGLAMNIKANMKLGQMDEVEDFSVAASPEDTANSIGACFLAMCRESKKNSGVSKKVTPLDSMYLGPEVTNEEISRAITSNNLEEFCNIQKNIEPEFIAARLAEGIVIGRCAERMEFGARSLGNRSILADPRNPEIVNRINKIIKMRDFWMPFAPVILDTYWEKYLVNKKGLFSPFMMIGFETTSLGRKDMPAAIHSADNTTRPQMLKENVNPDYYRIVSEFEKITGVGALLNTSFNLHGYPIVRTAEDAIDVFLNSHLDALLLNNTYIEKEHENKTDV
jgi:carbamoyltransferase